mgnify:CR=1 FL=1
MTLIDKYPHTGLIENTDQVAVKSVGVSRASSIHIWTVYQITDL